jgi:beta-phosphoglucomutase-like phosphatase (HAD superfamily)
MSDGHFDLIIFDCDGVLVDSEVISTKTLMHTLLKHGLDVDLSYVRRT